MRLDGQLGYNVYRTALLMRRQLTRVLRNYDLTPEQWQTMVSLWHAKGLTPTQIRQITLQDLPSISRMLVRMERRGWIRKCADPKDGRSYNVVTTDSGRRLEQRVVRAVLSHFDDLLEPFERARQDQLRDLLVELKHALMGGQGLRRTYGR